MVQETYQQPADGWVCFHCGERFTTFGAGEDHFGSRPDDIAACLIKVGSERGLVMELRRVQAELRELRWQHADRSVSALQREVDRLTDLLNSPVTKVFLKGVEREAAHQEARQDEYRDEDKTPEDWFWLVGYLSGKALRAHIDGNECKARHHTISTAAVLSKWHRAIGGGTPIEPPEVPEPPEFPIYVGWDGQEHGEF